MKITKITTLAMQAGGQAAGLLPIVQTLKETFDYRGQKLGKPRTAGLANKPSSLVICYVPTLAKGYLERLRREAAKVGLTVGIWDRGLNSKQVSFQGV